MTRAKVQPATLDPRAFARKTARFREAADDEDGRRRAIEAFVQDRATKLGRYVDEPSIDRDGKTTSVKVYRMYDDCIGCLRDLKKIWNIDVSDDARPTAHAFYKVGLISSDLIPIINATAGAGPLGDRIALQATQLLIGMTWPIDVAEELREARDMKDEEESDLPVDYVGLKNIQLHYKAVLLGQPQLLSKIFTLALPALKKRRVDRVEKDLRVISLVLHLFRNLLAIADSKESDPTMAAADNITRSSLQSDLLHLLHRARILDFLVQAASYAESDFAMFNTLILEIFYLIFAKVDREELLLVTTVEDDALRQKYQANADKENRPSTEDTPGPNAPSHVPQDGGSMLRQRRLQDMLAKEDAERSILQRGHGSRHSRFGTTIQVRTRPGRTDGTRTSIEDSLVSQKTFNLHKQAAIQQSPSKIIDQKKKTRWQRPKLTEGSETVAYSPQTLILLRGLALQLLDYGFNPLTASIRRDMEYSRENIKEVDYARFMSFLSIMLYIARNVRAQELAWGVQHAAVTEDEEEETLDGHDFNLVAVATEKKTFALVLRRMVTGLDDRQWKDLTATCGCFTELLLLMEAMSSSGREEFVDAAETCMMILFHEQAHFDCFVSIIKSYQSQHAAFMEVVIAMSYHVLRILDKLTKTKTIFIRKKRAFREKKAKKLIGEGAEELAEDGVEAEPTTHIKRQVQYKEQALKLSTLERAYADEKILDVCMTYLHSYRDFQSSEKLKMTVGLLHRIAVKVGAVSLFFKLGYLNLFSTILHDLPLLPRDAVHNDLGKLLHYLIKSYFKKVEKDSWAIVELLFPPQRSEIKKEFNRASSSEDEGRIAAKLPRVPAEFQIKPGFSWNEQVRIAVSVLIESEKLWSAIWLKNVLGVVARARTEFILRNAVDDDPQAVDLSAQLTPEEIASIRQGHTKKDYNFEDYLIRTEDEKEQHGMRYDSQIKLLLSLTGCIKSGEDAHELQWHVPASLTPDDLGMRVRLIEDAIRDPLNEEGKKASDLLKRISKTSAKKKRVRDADDGSLSEEDSRPRAKKRAQERAEYRSAQFIEDSDDDLEADAIFFAKEQALARQVGQAADLAAKVSIKPVSQDTSSQPDASPTATDSSMIEGHRFQSREGSSVTPQPRKPSKSRPRARPRANSTASESGFEATSRITGQSGDTREILQDKASLTHLFSAPSRTTRAIYDSEDE